MTDIATVISNAQTLLALDPTPRLTHYRDQYDLLMRSTADPLLLAEQQLACFALAMQFAARCPSLRGRRAI